MRGKMSKEKSIPKEYAIVVSLVMFFAIVILVGGIRLYLISKYELEPIDLENIDVIEENTNISMESYNIRIANSIKSIYGIDVYYGATPELSSVKAVALTDSTVIFDMLREINAVLEAYPKNIVREIESKGYELSIYLVDYFTNNVEALANRNSIGQMKIYISNTADINRALHHEYYHILDYYIRLEADDGLAYINWKNFNPKGFEYTEDVDNITSKYVYYGGEGAFFVTPYAKYSEKEDRAETFAEMVTASKEEVFFNEDGPIKGKINIIKKVLYDTFKSVREESDLVWE